ncbi:MAG: hypothetical protein WCD04_15790 [Terriglobia bacterium]
MSIHTATSSGTSARIRPVKMIARRYGNFLEGEGGKRLRLSGWPFHDYVAEDLIGRAPRACNAPSDISQ